MIVKRRSFTTLTRAATFRSDSARTLAVIVCLLSLTGCTKGPSTSSASSAGNSDTNIAAIPNHAAKYVGSKACAECHQELSKSFAQHPMANSMAKASAASPAEDFENTEFQTSRGMSYRVDVHERQMSHHEIRKTDDGTVIYEKNVPIDYAVGSGMRGRSYLMDVEGWLFQSPITWYTESHSWALSPGFDAKSHAGFERRLSHACLACHAGNSIPHATDPDRFASPPFAEVSIGCERCHGPGSEHVSWQKLAATDRSGVDPIVNPAHLSGGLQDAVCNQCHLQGQRRVLREGKSEFGFRPGMKLNDIWVTILKTQGVGSGVADAVSQVEQMHASTCFAKSDGQMTCTSCHDPHGFPSPVERVSFYRTRCVNCHGDDQQGCSEQPTVRDAQQDSCIACHMPRFGAADVHSSQTDHRVLRRQPTQSDTAALQDGEGTRRAGTIEPQSLPIFEEAGFEISDADRERAIGILLAERAYLYGDSRSARKAVQLLIPRQLETSTDVSLLVGLAEAYLQIDRDKDATEVLERVLTLQPTHGEALELLATSAHESNQLELARTTYQKLLKLNPHRSRYYGRYSHVAGQLNDIESAIAAGEKALELDPSLQQTHAWLIDMYTLAGNPERAAWHAEKLQTFKTESPNPE